MSYIIQEMQTNEQGQTALLPPVIKTTQAEAEGAYYIALGYAAISTIAVHTVILYTTDGDTLMSGCYRHGGET